jgi:polyphosphate kinase 2 (PPK2 family)
VRVHPELLRTQRLPERDRGADVWKRRYREINDWERYLVDNGIVVLKVFLNLSKGEQRRRFLERVEDKEKNWKFSAADARERQHWDEYQEAYSQMLSHTSTGWAPWYVVPADHKWFARICVSAILAHTLMQIDPQYPVLDAEAKAELDAARAQLEAEVD